MNNKLILAAVAVIAIIVVAAGGFYFLNANKSQTPSLQEISQPTSIPTSTSELSPETTSVNEITVEGEEFKLTPSEITVKKGEKVKITFKNTGNFQHDFVIAGLGVATKRINPGEEDSVEFTADKTGQLKFICSVGNHEEQGMTGTLTVE